jgi:hypothetical protein
MTSIRKLGVQGRLIYYFFLGYHDMGTKFPPQLAMTNLPRVLAGHTRGILPSQPNP